MRPREKMENSKLNEEDIRFVARFYDPLKMDTSEAWKKLKLANVTEIKYHSILYRIASVAAVLMIVIGSISIYLYTNRDKQDWITVTTDGEHSLVYVLPDSSTVYLAKEAILKYNRGDYDVRSRNVELSGKAFFEVCHKEESPFIVKTSIAGVQVLGTCFQVQADLDTTSIFVDSGKVRFYNKKYPDVILEAGEGAYAVKDGNMKKDTNVDVNILSWKTNIFYFRDTPLPIVIKKLEEVYGVHIINIPQKDYHLTSSFHDISVSEIINLINEALDIHLKIEL